MQENEKIQSELELGMQELEAMEAPGFWGDFGDGFSTVFPYASGGMGLLLGGAGVAGLIAT